MQGPSGLLGSGSAAAAGFDVGGAADEHYSSFMKYADLIERALAEVKGSDASLAALLGGVDALDHSVSTVGELNDAFREVEKRGRFPSHDWRPVEQSAYEKAIAENWERMAQLLESQGVSREQQQKALEWHRKIWSKT